MAHPRLHWGDGYTSHMALLTLQLPDDVEAALRGRVEGDLSLYAREALAVQLYRDRKLTHGQVGRFLGISSYQVDTVLKSHGGVDELTSAELADQVSVSQRVRQRRGNR